MRSLLFALLCGALSGCDQPTPCDDVPGTCLYVNVQSQGDGGERIDGIRFGVEGDRLTYQHSYAASAGGQLLPITVGLPLPDDAERSVRVTAEALRGEDVILRGLRTVADLERGQHRFIWIVLRPVQSGAM